MMSFGFRSQSHKESCFQILVTASFSNNFLYVNLFIRKEACSDLPIGSESKPVAVATEMTTHSPDQTNFSSGAIKTESSGWPIPSI